MKHLANPAVPGSENIPAPTDVDVYARIMVVVEAVNVQVTVAGKRARSSFFRKAQKNTRPKGKQNMFCKPCQLKLHHQHHQTQI